MIDTILSLMDNFGGSSNKIISMGISLISILYYLYNFYTGTVCSLFEGQTRNIILGVIIVMFISICGALYYFYTNSNTEEFSNKNNFGGGILSLLGLNDGEENDVKDEKFLNSLSEEKRKFYIAKENELIDYNNDNSLITPKYQVLQTNLPLEVKNQILKKIDGMDNNLNPFAERDQKWVDSFLKLPLEQYNKMPIKKGEIKSFFSDLKSNLDKTLYGQEKVKSKILEVMAQWISNPVGTPPVIGLCGPPGIGKTTIIRSLASSLNRPFAFVSMGGIKDGAELKGHSQTYVGSVWGKIVQILMETKCMNPVIFFDELDKISDLGRNEINGVLMALIDGSQNSQFQDAFFHGIDLDLSKALFIFSFNDKNSINKVLFDRITTIDMDGYQEEDKIKIIKNYVLPQTLVNNGLKNNDVFINDENISYLIEKYCRNEPGMRDLIHKIEDIVGKINLTRLINNGENNGENDSKDKNNNLILPYKLKEIVFPLEITKDLLHSFL